jgi:hypothetical protein
MNIQPSITIGGSKMISKYDEAPEQVRKFAFSLMHLCIRRELENFDDPEALLTLGAHAGVDPATHAQALRWLAAQEINRESKGVITRVGAREAADRYLAYASKIEAIAWQRLREALFAGMSDEQIRAAIASLPGVPDACA